jgi:hypothetical protein
MIAYFPVNVWLMTVVYLFITLIILLLIIAAFLPGKYHLEHSTIIKKSLGEVRDKVADLHYFAKWNPWQLMETKGTFNISGDPKTVGHTYSWKGRKTGVGKLSIRAIDDRHVHFDLTFIKPWKAHAKDNWFFEEWGREETKVTWQNNGDLPFPVPRLMGKMIHKNLNKQFVEGLNNLKRLCEQ